MELDLKFKQYELIVNDVEKIVEDGVFERKSLTFWAPSFALMITPLTISTDLLIFFKVGSISVLIIVVVSFKFFVKDETSNRTFTSITPTKITIIPVA